ncbi:hypothetical protein [Flavihumibacter sp.]|uniref:hypothetical protein n=1 Tax=Flavihumibacter sp. TaxID=1913981 RepID=UPI002FC8DDDA|nr:hypothetical protein [Flavihumibacter sediminis]
MARLKRKQWILYGVGLLLLGLLLSMGLLVRLRSVAAAKQLVKTLSGGEYALDASAIRVDPTRMTIKVARFDIHPVHPATANNEFRFMADSISVNLRDVINLLLFKRLNVESFSLVRPTLELRVYEKDSIGNRVPIPLHQQVSKIQTVFFDVLQSLEVKSCDIRQATIAYYPDLNNNNSRYFINNLHLNITDLHLLKRVTNWNNNNEVSIRFELQNPLIEYPDTTIRVNLDQLLWDNRQRKFELNGLGFHKTITTIGDSTGFRLEGIELDSLNWNKLLTEGVVELAMLKASKGFFSSNDFRIRRKKDSTDEKDDANLLDIIGPIYVKQLSIDDIEFIGNSHTPRGKESFRVQGNAFDVKELVVDKNIPNKIAVKELQLKVKAYLESDSSKNFSSGFGELNINKNDLVLYDYFLQTRQKSRLGNNRIDVKRLTLTDLSIPELLQGRLKAEELIVSGANVKLQLQQRENRNNRVPWRRIQRAIGRKLEINTIRILDADLLITKEDQRSALVNATAFSAVISGKNLLDSRTLEALMNGNNSIDLPSLEMQLPGGWASMKGVIYRRQSISATSARGNMNNGNIQFNLKDIVAEKTNAAGIIKGSENNWLEALTIGSGNIDITFPEEKNTSATGNTQYYTSKFRSGPLRLKIAGKGINVLAITDSVSADDLYEAAGNFYWKNLYLKGRTLNIQLEKLKGSTGEYELGGNSENKISNGNWEIFTDKIYASVNLPNTRVIHNIETSKDIPRQISRLIFSKPHAEIHLLPLTAPTDKESTSSTILIPSISLEDPGIVLSRHEDGQEKQIASLDGGLVNTAAFTLTDGEWKSDSIDARFQNLKANPGNFKVDFPLLHFKMNDARIPTGESFKSGLAFLEVANAGLQHQKGANSFTLEGITGKLTSNMRFNSHRDSLKALLVTLPKIEATVSHFKQKNKDRITDLRGLKLNPANGTLSFDSLSWSSDLTREDFFQNQPFQTDLIQLSSGIGVINGLKMLPSSNDTVWKMNRLDLTNLNLQVDRDKRVPRDSISYRPLLAKTLQNIPFLFELDSITLKNSLVRYNEISEKTGAEGSILFANLDATILNIRNNSITKEDSLKIIANALLMDEGQIGFYFNQAYTDSLQRFQMRADLGKMELKSFTPMLKPLFGLEILKGHTDSVIVEVKGDDHLAIGKMHLDYRNLRIQLSREDGKRKGALTFLANTILRNKNDRTAAILQERMRDRSTFNFWGKIALSGLLGNLGLQNNERKIRAYKKQN